MIVFFRWIVIVSMIRYSIVMIPMKGRAITNAKPRRGAIIRASGKGKLP